MKQPASTGNYSVFWNDNVVYFEHHLLGEDDAICCYLEGNTVVDYDMAFGMCDEVRDWLEANGYMTEEIL